METLECACESEKPPGRKGAGENAARGSAAESDRVGGGREGELRLEKGRGRLRPQYPSQSRKCASTPDGTGGGAASLGA